MDKWLKGFLLFIIVISITSWLLMDWGLNKMSLVHSETIDTEDLREYQQFQRDCIKRGDVVLHITIYNRDIRAWRLTCQWEEQP